MAEPVLAPDAINPERIREVFTARELGKWESTVGVTLPEFGAAYLGAMLAWWAARQEDPDEPRSPDEFLDMSMAELTPYMERAADLLGKPQTGAPQPSGTSTPSGSASLPSLPTSTSKISA